MTNPGKAGGPAKPGASEDGAGTVRRRRKATSGKTVYRAPALDKGLQIVELLADKQRPMAMPEIAQALGRSKTEIYRMLVVLEGHGYIERGEHDDRYSITSRLFELGMRNAPKRNLHDAALPVMHELAESTLQSCHLMLQSDDHMVAIARVESPAAIGFAVSVGYRVPILHSTSARLLYGFQPQNLKAAWLKTVAASAPSQSAVKRFVAEAEEISARGYCIEASRLADGITDVAAPVFDGEALGAVASLVVPFLSHKFLAVPLEEVATRVQEAAHTISDRLRHG